MNRFKTKYCYIAALLSLTFFSPLATASHLSTLDLWSETSCTRFVMALSAGPSWQDVNTGETQTFSLTPRITKTFARRNQRRTVTEGELFIGLQTDLSDAFQFQYGLELATTSDGRLSGNVWDDANSRFNNYTYSYEIQHSLIAAAGKILLSRCEGLIPCYGFIPWAGVSLGMAFNYSHGYENTPLIFQAVPTSNFTSHTKTSFSYTLALGLQKALSEHLQLGANYEFADWGKSRLGRAAGQTLNTGLTNDHLYTNGVLFNMTYIA